jgi:hypothetical protein
MKKFLFLFGFLISDSYAAVLCKDPAVSDVCTFTCPFITNIGSDGTDHFPKYSDECTTPASDGVNSWNATGPWGNKGISITITGDSRCSTTNGSHAIAGHPVTGDGTGQYCWCRIRRDSGAVGAWLFRNNLTIADDCTLHCAYNCTRGGQVSSEFRAALCAASCVTP